MKTIVIYIVMGLLCLHVGYSQQIQITGTVTDKNTGDPLPGVNVLIKGTTTGTISDINGQYTVLGESNGVIVFSFIGYVTREIAIAGQTQIDVALEEEYEELKKEIALTKKH